MQHFMFNSCLMIFMILFQFFSLIYSIKEVSLYFSSIYSTSSLSPRSQDKQINSLIHSSWLSCTLSCDNHSPNKMQHSELSSDSAEKTQFQSQELNVKCQTRPVGQLQAKCVSSIVKKPPMSLGSPKSNLIEVIFPRSVYQPKLLGESSKLA